MRFFHPQLLCRLKECSWYSNSNEVGTTPSFLKTPVRMILDPDISYESTEDKLLFDEFISDDNISIRIRNLVRRECIRKTKEHGKEKDILISKWYELEQAPMLSKTNKAAKQVILDYISNGFKIDESLIAVFSTDVLCVLPTFDPVGFMPYQDHVILFTNASTGKSHIADRTGLLSTSISSKYLKGFSSASKVDTHFGAANNLTLPLTFDELQEQPEQIETLKGLMTLLDVGKDRTMMGHGTPPVRTYLRLRIQGNPHVEFGEMSDDKLVMEFQSFMKKITSNYRAAMRRFSLLIFDDNILEAEGKPLPPVELSELRDEFNAIREACSENYTKLYMNSKVISYLNTKHDDKYIEKLDEIGKGLSEYSKNERELVAGMKINFRRVRGMALKLSLIDNLRTLADGKIDITALLKISDKYYKYIAELQLKNLNNILRVEVDTDMWAELLSQKYKVLSQFDKALLKTINNIGECSSWVVLGTLKLSENYEKHDASSSFIVSKIMGVSKDLDSVNERLTQFGVRFGMKHDEIVIKFDHSRIAEVLGNE